MSFLMFLQTPLKFWQMCKKSLAKISGTPQFFIRHVNNAGGRWNGLWTLTSRLTGRQGRCELRIVQGRKDELIRKHYEKLGKWKEMLADAQVAPQHPSTARASRSHIQP